MGKDLRGKELGVGITQRKDGLYQGRYNYYVYQGVPYDFVNNGAILGK